MQLRVINYRKDVAPDYHATINQLCALAGFSPSTSFEMGQIYASLGLVSAGFGVTLVPASVQRTHMDNVVYRPLREQHAQSELYLAWKEPNPPAVLVQRPAITFNNWLHGLSWSHEPRSSCNASEAGQEGPGGTAGADQAHDGCTA
jgi:hypothetical protein